MSYYVHEGRIKNKAVIHEAACRFCNNGQGTRPDHNPKNHLWHGPYADLKAAWQAAEATGRKDKRECLTCLPKR